MGYQALLFCPDDKTARTVTQVLSELEFTVETCTEPFAAVKKLMGEHFDAVVVDCDNEQNATLLFKSARNSTSNQTSLAVAVVEGQAGVAKAFRIGANLVLTKPINIEQAKGTLRVARGLLRKSDPTKPGTATGSFAVPTAPTGVPAASAAPAPPKPAAPKPAATVKPATSNPLPPKPVAPGATASLKAPQSLPPKPATTAAWPSAASAKTGAVGQDENVASAAKEKTTVPAAPSAPPPLYNATLATPVIPKPPVSSPVGESRSVASSSFVSGAASAPAPAREPEAPKVEQKPAAADEVFQKAAAPAQSESQAYVGSAPSFTFGGASAERQSAGGNKKIFIGVAAALLVAIGGYFTWSHFKGTGEASPQQVASSGVTTGAPTKAASVSPATTAPAASAPASQPEVTPRSSKPAEESESSTPVASSKPSASSAKSSGSSSKSAAQEKAAVAEKPSVAEKAEEPALVVKSGKIPAAGPKSAASADAQAPSMIGIAAPSSAALPNLGSATPEFKPVLQTLSVSQGVSQGLLYKKVAPSYPQNALRMHIEGIVELMATISKTGDITHVKVLSGDAQLAKAATDAVKQWKYKPYLLNGEPVEIQTQVTVNFKMPR